MIGPSGPPKDTAPQRDERIGSQAEKAQRSAAFDAVLRMQLGQDCRTIEDKINDKNRPTWEQYKKDNEDALNLSGADQKKMQSYRAELDAERARKLARASKTNAFHDSDSDASDDRKKRKRKKEKKKLKKDAKKKARKILKKEKKKRKRRGSSSSSSSDDVDAKRRRSRSKSPG